MNHLRILLRNLVKQKMFSLINICGLAIGIAVCSLIFLWVEDELSFDRYHEKLDGIYQVVLNVEGTRWESSNWALSPLLKRDYPEIEKATRYASRNVLLQHESHSFYENGALVDADFLDIFTYRFVQGSPETALSTDNSIILSETSALRLFGTANPVGRSVRINDAADLAVTGVIQDVPENSSFQFGFLAPVRLLGEERLNSWATESRSYVLLRPDTQVQDLIEKISGVVMANDTRTDQQVEVSLRPYGDIHLHALNSDGTIVYVYFFSAIAVLILLIACINFINLATARAQKRAKEIGVRKAVGATKRNIIRQFMCESLLSSFIALMIAVLLVEVLTPAFSELSGKELALNVTGNMVHALGLLLIALVAGLVSGFYPALVLSSFRPVKALKISVSTGSSKSPFRKFLVVSQFAATVVLIIGSLVIHKQLQYISNKDLGFNRDNIVVVPLNNGLKAQIGPFKNEIRSLPGVIDATCATNIPTSVGNVNPVYWEGHTSEDYVAINWVAVDYDYFDTFEMRLAEGRTFSVDHPVDSQNYVVNEAASALMNLDTTVGRMFSIWDNEGQIIGVVKDFHSRSLHDGIVPVVFTISPGWNWSLGYLFAKIKPDDVSGTVEDIRRTAAAFAPAYPFDYFFLDDHFEQQYADDRQTGTLFNYFTYVAIFISCLGLFGLTTYVTEQRTREIGIRKVMGASKSRITLLLLKESLLVVLVANIVAWPVGYMITQKLMSSYAYRAGIGIGLYIVAGLTVLLLAGLTISVQTLRAARANPVDSLRCE